MARRKPKHQQPADAPAIEVAISEHDELHLKKAGEGKLDKRAKIIFAFLGVTAAVFVFGLIVPRNIFDEYLHISGYHDGYTLSWFVNDLMENVNGLFALFAGDEAGSRRTASLIMTYLVIMVCGAGLALCGAVYQGTFRNALVSPSSLGVMSGAGLGMALWVALLYDPAQSHGLWFEGAAGTPADPLAQLWNSYSLSLCSFVGCIIVVGLVVLVIGTVGKGSTSGFMMIITGQVIGSIMGGIVSSIRYYFITVDPDGAQAQMLMELQISSFYRAYSPIDVIAVGVPVLIMFLVVMHYRQELTLLAFSEAEARAMGVETRRMRFLIVGLATLVTAIIVSFCGRVGFVGFMLPLLARRVVGPNFTYLFPFVMVAGAAFVLAAYVLILVILGDSYATMSGMFISIGGAIVFFVTAVRQGGGKRGAF